MHFQSLLPRFLSLLFRVMVPQNHRLGGHGPLLGWELVISKLRSTGLVSAHPESGNRDVKKRGRERKRERKRLLMRHPR
jgi:hypothetical protein